MHVDTGPDNNATLPPGVPWYKLLTKYHWFVFVVAALGWLFDCLDQQLFILARPAAMKELLAGTGIPEAAMKGEILKWSDIATAVFIAGWATGGLVFGMLGDRIGRTKTMMFTILIYSACTGLSALSTSVYDFAFYRFLTGLGVGGEFAVGVALIAEAMPAAARPYALASLQALSAIGNILAALINLGLGVAEEHGLPTSPWRIMFMIGALPALLALIIRLKLKEPEAWTKVSHEGATAKQLGSYRELFSTPLWRKHALLGLVLACSGVVGLWGVGFYTPDLIRSVQTPKVTKQVYEQEIAAAEGATAESLKRVQAAIESKTSDQLPAEDQAIQEAMDKKVSSKVSLYTSFTSIAINIGAFFGMYGFGVLAQRIGRKPTFAIALISAFTITVIVFHSLTDMWQIMVLVPIMGFCQLSLFAGYAVYLPELFPTRLRSTGTSFCYNVGRFVAAFGPLVKIAITGFFITNTFGYAEPLRPAGMAMCGVFLIGLLVLPFLPETKGKPLPE
ncbi:Putative sialic acid transporter [Caulifigura coniformis]|uniref:Sialic acid transporter n=1 Tax=Caulifigura coniformis TaxID=2527983 RepID=A0A517SCJ6_9PLAN|nr:MFS transporter [Caulifigura coniformis]QDT53852.1 Putative sialic acid transporter [Caulifigura coniformis]